MDYTQYVNTNIGTIGHLLQATAPGVQSPHGAAVISPVTREGMKDVYNSDRIFGFRAGGAYVMPLGPGMEADYVRSASIFDHDFEVTRPDYYEVYLEDCGVQECHTATENLGIFRFTYETPASENRAAIYVPGFVDSRRDGELLYITSKHPDPWCAPMHVLFYIGKAEIEVRSTKSESGAPMTALVLTFPESTITLPFAMSPLGYDSLTACWQERLSKESFETIRGSCNSAWNALLGKIRVQGGTEAQKTVFYTALYRATARMHNYSVGGKYLGFDGQIHEDQGHNYYCDDGIWDTYRGMHPLQLILEPQVHRDILESYLRMYSQSGWLPRFPNLGGNAPCMIGHHTVSILAESMAKGLDFNWNLAYEAAYKNATQRTMLPWRDGEAEELTKHYYAHGYLPALEEDEEETDPHVHPFENRQAVAVTIEHSYDDWCLARMAQQLGKTEDAAYFDRRAMNYKKLYDPEIGFFHPRKADGSFTKVYNPKYCGGQGGRKYFAENNAYIYAYAAQHDMEGLVELHGGKDAFAAKLDNLYIEQYDGWLKSTFLNQYPDATGLMGQFCMGNEPSFHIPYLYNYCGQAYKTQRKIHELIRLWFTDSPLGICGDEDGGAMSAFLVFSAMGFYPVNPASCQYDLGSPIFDRIEMDLPNGKTFTVRAEGAAQKAKYIQAASLNGKPLTAPKFSHTDMMEGGELLLTMGQRPNKALFG